MKKLLMAAGVATVLTLGFGVAPASAAPNFSQLCTDNGDFGVSHGECTSILNGFYNKGKGNNDAAALCKDFKVTDPDNFAAFFGNVGQCVKLIGPLLPG